MTARSFAGPVERDEPVAIVDIGSNSGRVVVYRIDAAGQLRLLACTRAALRLVREVDSGHTLGPAAIARSLAALRDFRAIALGAGARRVVAVATAAVRDARDGAELIARARRELGLEIHLIDGEEEARYGFLGALHGLPFENGLLFDMGGGSLQVTRFRGRRPLHAVSLPLGALRLSQAFLRSDPPDAAERRRLRRHVRALLERAGIGPLPAGDVLVGTGGTVRNLAKVDRRAHGYPITRVHGYTLARRRVREITELLAARRQRKRDSVPGLSDERGDSIVGGAEGIGTLMQVCGARALHVSGQGVREGLAFNLVDGHVPPLARVREASIASLVARFDGWRADSAERRSALADRLARVLLPHGTDELRGALVLAARLLDVGRSVDFFDRHEHTADIVLATELNGYAHREIALLSAVLRRAGDDKADEHLLSPLVREDEHADVERAAVVLALADDIEERCPPGGPIVLRCRLTADALRVHVPRLMAWRERSLERRFERAFERRLRVHPSGA
jgi:exopolyphosphatase/guanosine-5'-triphosphate,3'-diphosphate pyrophosphatase